MSNVVTELACSPVNALITVHSPPGLKIHSTFRKNIVIFHNPQPLHNLKVLILVSTSGKLFFYSFHFIPIYVVITVLQFKKNYK